ncbi:hypothetical protein L195_g037808 [Trifolium pratense]|uniref:Uncharacterized protein n=1 Tax=Trifolium pratense TaxID=57577 RepID=A0A2K3LGX3_TRIPR|nr:hypothetical protein L195_g033747 [Trifolium pratense]PNX81783.1 hypothetical protein L195_g037808 [Trifolium pratense]
MQVSGVISDVMVVVLPSSSSLRLPEFRHLHASDAKTFLSGGGFLKWCNFDDLVHVFKLL